MKFAQLKLLQNWNQNGNTLIFILIIGAVLLATLTVSMSLLKSRSLDGADLSANLEILSIENEVLSLIDQTCPCLLLPNSNIENTVYFQSLPFSCNLNAKKFLEVGKSPISDNSSQKIKTISYTIVPTIKHDKNIAGYFRISFEDKANPSIQKRILIQKNIIVLDTTLFPYTITQCSVERAQILRNTSDIH